MFNIFLNCFLFYRPSNPIVKVTSVIYDSRLFEVPGEDKKWFE